MVYRETIVAGVAPRMDELSLVLGCLKLPHDISVRNRLIENLGYNSGPSKGANLCSLINGFGEYDPRAFSLVEVCQQLPRTFYLFVNSSKNYRTDFTIIF